MPSLTLKNIPDELMGERRELAEQGRRGTTQRVFFMLAHTIARRAVAQRDGLAFDEKLRHYADNRIRLDLDDGVKVNYGKFADLLTEVKAVHGKKPERV